MLTERGRIVPVHEPQHRPIDRIVAVLGLGYVGLPTGLALAEAGAGVVGCEISEGRLASIKAGRVDLVPSDHRRLRTHLGSKSFVLTTNMSLIETADTVVICVPTPVDGHQVPDLSALEAACRTAVDHVVAGQTIVLTSTTYVGCTRELLVAPLEATGLTVGRDVFVAFAPERIDPGNLRFGQDSVPRVVGGVTEACTSRAAETLRLVAPRVHAVSSPESAEATKLLENSFRAVNIALANEFADVCRQFGVGIVEVIEAAATKPYGFMPFYPGPGVGGHCIPCDPHYLLWQARGRRIQLPLVESAMTAIALRPGRVVARAVEVLAEAGKPVTGARILISGVTYKPGVSDLRGSPAMDIIADLTARGATVDFTDEYVEVVSADGRCLGRIADPAERRWDLVIIHTLHPGADDAWLGDCDLVLDSTYRATARANRVAL